MKFVMTTSRFMLPVSIIALLVNNFNKKFSNKLLFDKNIFLRYNDFRKVTRYYKLIPRYGNFLVDSKGDLTYELLSAVN